MSTEQKHTPGSLPYFIDVYGHIYRWEKVEGGEKSVPVANWQGSGSAKESIALIDQANAADSLRAEAERLREALRDMVAHCKVAPIYPGKDGGKMQDNGYAAFERAKAALAWGKP